MTNDIRVLIVDDSLIMRRLLSDLLEEDHDISVVGTASNGIEAIKKTNELRPTVITMDIEMPKMDGLTALQYIMNENPVPIVMLSAMNKRQADIVMKALEMGAVDFITKTSGTLSLDIEKAGSAIITKIKEAAAVKVNRIKPKMVEKILVSEFKHPAETHHVVAIGASTGGPKALLEVLASLPRDIPASILIAQHMPQGFTQSLAERLNWQSSIEVREAREGDILQRGVALIAPGDRHMMVKNDEVLVTNGAKVNNIRPSVDVLMESAAEQYGPNVIGVLMTGMGQDGADGMKRIKDRGGKTIAQDQETCAVFGMPKAAIDKGAVDKIVPLNKIAREIISMLKVKK